MWIVPKTLSHFVPATEGLNLDLEERAWMLESSAMWRSKPSSRQTWLRRLKKDGWMMHLSTRILKPSLHESFEEKYTASLEDIPVSPSVAQGEAKRREKTQDTYGLTSEAMSRAIRPLWCFFENVRGHTTMGLWRVLSDLEEDGYQTEWGLFSAEETGAPHQRIRCFILAYHNIKGLAVDSRNGECSSKQKKKGTHRKHGRGSRSPNTEAERVEREGEERVGTSWRM